MMSFGELIVLGIISLILTAIVASAIESIPDTTPKPTPTVVESINNQEWLLNNN